MVSFNRINDKEHKLIEDQVKKYMNKGGTIQILANDGSLIRKESIKKSRKK